MAQVIHMKVSKIYAQEAELADRIKALIYEYVDQISLVAALGVLEVVKIDIHQDAK
jgi:hypothetical protein